MTNAWSRRRSQLDEWGQVGDSSVNAGLSLSLNMLLTSTVHMLRNSEERGCVRRRVGVGVYHRRCVDNHGDEGDDRDMGDGVPQCCRWLMME